MLQHKSTWATPWLSTRSSEAKHWFTCVGEWNSIPRLPVDRMTWEMHWPATGAWMRRLSIFRRPWRLHRMRRIIAITSAACWQQRVTSLPPFPQFEHAAKLSRTPQPGILQMLAAMYSENGRYPEAVATARRALELANQQGDSVMASSLEDNLQHYASQAKAGIPDSRQDRSQVQPTPGNTPQSP